MAPPFSAKTFVSLLDKWSIPYEMNHPSWATHNRNHKGDWGPIHGIGNHHTGAADNTAGASVLWRGTGDLPGPLCHGGIRQNGKILLNGWGRANHFGLGDDDVFAKVKNEDYSGTLKPNEANTDGNAHFIGFEWMYSGLVNPETEYPKMWRSAVLVNAAICTYYKWTEKSCIGHGEWQPGKWDPGYRSGHMVSMSRFRNHVKQAIAEGPPKKAPSNPPYTVRDGDNLYKIAKRKLGNGARYKEIAKLNNIDPDAILQIGRKLKLPKK